MKDERNQASKNFFVNRGLPENAAQVQETAQTAAPSYVRTPINNTFRGQQPDVYRQPYQQQAGAAPAVCAPAAAGSRTAARTGAACAAVCPAAAAERLCAAAAVRASAAACARAAARNIRTAAAGIRASAAADLCAAGQSRTRDRSGRGQ